MFKILGIFNIFFFFFFIYICPFFRFFPPCKIKHLRFNLSCCNIWQHFSTPQNPLRIKRLQNPSCPILIFCCILPPPTFATVYRHIYLQHFSLIYPYHMQRLYVAPSIIYTTTYNNDLALLSRHSFITLCLWCFFVAPSIIYTTTYNNDLALLL